ncbi:polysaccharide biosynthesis/export family protein [Pseudooceanicola sp. C21-150M6]|uniref:polysaccharide biosynthesis/export family protein n=1 Tax=Pseudooceanicola sp. C21-150M6 TaxID=3434355 RepID=UPI003D7FAD22
MSAVLALALSAPAGWAEGYRIVAGDELNIFYAGATTSELVSVDADGQVRLVDLGGVTVAGLTLDDAETALVTAMETQGLYVSPRVSLAVADYAPIVVAGDVSNPGRVDYLPGMTVGSALALSGGSQTSGMTRNELVRARTEAESNLRTTNLDIAAAVVRMARFEAMLKEDDQPLVLSDALKARIPSPAAVDLDTLLANEQSVLSSLRQRTTELQDFWDREIEVLTAQSENYDRRMAVQEEIVLSAAKALDDARELQERGLQTSSRLSVVEQRDADARSRVLELESAKMQATRAIGNAERDRVQFLANQRDEALTGQQSAGVELDGLELRYQRFTDLLGLLTGGNSGALLASDAVSLNFTLQTPRSGRPSGSDVSLETPLLPGETLIVTISAALDDLGG